MTPRQAVVLLLSLISVTLGLLAFETATAAPPALAPTEEPTKRPYVFPTPIFIPTYPADNPAATAAPQAPAKTPVVTSPPPAGAESYTVQSGDNPWTIAQKVCGNGAKSSSIMQENNIADAARLRVGTVLKIPADCLSGSPVLSAPPTLVATTLPVPTPAAVSLSIPISTPVSSVRTSSPSTFGNEVNVMWQVGMMVINIGSGLLLIGSVISGASAWMVYRRIQFVKEMTHRVHRLRIRQKRTRFG